MVLGNSWYVSLSRYLFLLYILGRAHDESTEQFDSALLTSRQPGTNLEHDAMAGNLENKGEVN